MARFLFLLPVLFLLGCPPAPKGADTRVVKETCEVSVDVKKVETKWPSGHTGSLNAIETPTGWIVWIYSDCIIHVPDTDHRWLVTKETKVEKSK